MLMWKRSAIIRVRVSVLTPGSDGQVPEHVAVARASCKGGGAGWLAGFEEDETLDACLLPKMLFSTDCSGDAAARSCTGSSSCSARASPTCARRASEWPIAISVYSAAIADGLQASRRPVLEWPAVALRQSLPMRLPTSGLCKVDLWASK